MLDFHLKETIDFKLFYFSMTKNKVCNIETIYVKEKIKHFDISFHSIDETLQRFTLNFDNFNWVRDKQRHLTFLVWL